MMPDSPLTALRWLPCDALGGLDGDEARMAARLILKIDRLMGLI